MPGPTQVFRRSAAFLLTLLLVHSAGASPKRWSRSTLDRDDGGRIAFIARAEAGSVVALDVATGHVQWEAMVGGRPEAILYEGGSEPRIYVARSARADIAVLDASTGKLRRRLPVGATPCGLTRVGAHHLVVTLQALHRVVLWDLVAGKKVASETVSPFPCAVAVSPDDSELYLVHRYAALLTVLDGDTLTPHEVLRGDPAMNQTAGILVAPRRKRLFLPHVLSHSEREDPSFVNSVLPAVSAVDSEAYRFLPEKRIEPAFVDRPVNGPEALALFRGGDALLVVHSRSNDVSAISLVTGLSLGHVSVGRFPVGVVVTPDERSAWVANGHEHTLSVIDLETLRETKRIPYGREVLPSDVARGRDLFHDAASPRMTKSRWLSCSNCHPGGGSDGRTWNLPGRGRLLTKDLRGVGRTLPAGWRGDRDELQDEELFIRGFLRGRGLGEAPPHPALGEPNAGLSDDLDALAAYLRWLSPPVSPHLKEGKPSAKARRGRELFLSERTGCATCHPPPLYTISGTEKLRRFAGLVTPRPTNIELDVPSLLGLAHRGRFLHDGRADSLRAVLTRWNADDLHGRTSDLEEQQLDDLEAFLLSLGVLPSARRLSPFASGKGFGETACDPEHPRFSQIIGCTK